MLPNDPSPRPTPSRSGTGVSWSQLLGTGGRSSAGSGVSGSAQIDRPGQSSMAAWAQAQQSGNYAVPDHIDELMTAAGYKRKDLPVEADADTRGLNMKSAKTLTEMRSGISQDELQTYIDSYGNHYEAPKDTEQQGPWKRPAVTTEAVTAAPMTPKAYEALSPEKKAAVDFNTALVAAREKDLNEGWLIRTMPQEAQDRYKQMFGEDAPTAGYAENTQSLLEKVGYSGDSKVTDFLNLDMALDVDELKNLDLTDKVDLGLDVTPKSQRDDTPGEKRRHMSFYNQPEGTPDGGWDAFRRTASQEYQDVLQVDLMQKVGKALEGYKANPMYSSAHNALASFGMGDPQGETLPIGWGNPATRTNPLEQQRETQYQTVLNTMLSTPNMPKLADDPAFWNSLKAAGYKEQDFNDLFSFLDARTRWMIQHGEGVGQGQNDPRRIRDLAGLEPVK